ncbi:putative metalloprotease CJM1_0395 family protein [Psychromonas sp. MME2]|uniref:putative metalloprotease CJM1_0395 family protein n=1 Tax=Psychromonas sp. MME2 TaxID=3231033 RepID=UPI00339D0AEB
MNISLTTISLPFANGAPLAPSRSEKTPEAVNLNAHTTVSISTVTDATQSNIAPPTYQRPINKQADGIASPSLNPNETKQQGEEPVVQDGDQTIVPKDKQSDPETPRTTNSRQEQYSDAELKEISSLKMRDTEVEIHERAHSSVGGQYAGAPSYTYQTGPDGVKYAVAGKVSIDTSAIANDPEATLRKAQQIKAAALAPAEPSGQDKRIAAKADQMAAQARNDILQENQKSDDIKGAASSLWLLTTRALCW